MLGMSETVNVIIQFVGINFSRVIHVIIRVFVFLYLFSTSEVTQDFWFGWNFPWWVKFFNDVGDDARILRLIIPVT